MRDKRTPKDVCGEAKDQPDQYRTTLLLEFLPSRHCDDKCIPGWPLLPRHEACLNKRMLHPKRNPGDRTI